MTILKFRKKILQKNNIRNQVKKVVNLERSTLLNNINTVR